MSTIHIPEKVVTTEMYQKMCGSINNAAGNDQLLTKQNLDQRNDTKQYNADLVKTLLFPESSSGLIN